MLTRRRALAGLAAAVGSRSAFAQSGPQADLYGAQEGYPVPSRLVGQLEGNPWPPKYRVGAFTHLDRIYDTRTVSGAAEPSPFKRASFEAPAAVADHLARQPVTGLLIARADRILFEQYQYGRTDRDRFVAQSMVKSITGLLVGLAIADGAIQSVDDLPEKYVPGFTGSEYGRTPIRALLHMSSGVEFGEDRDDGRDLNRLWRGVVAGRGPGHGTVDSIRQFNRRIAPPGTRYAYASIEPDVLGMVLKQAIGKTASAYLQERIWQPIGAESDATWLIDAEGYELAHFGFSAVLRDYARLGRLLAHDGAWNGHQIIPAQWMMDATTVRPSDTYLLPGKAMRGFGYGYLLWLLPGERRQFALVGDLGQRIIVDPPSKLVMVQTALDEADGASWKLWRTLVAQLG
ncbi:MAG: serine hydrolase [Reyranella sp.]|uniref:serine hydrolase domain-containing protein n=1 Tax=Reyranella sp. TaxID=1929291 RepID=UPI001ACEFAAF|nr:serine hydrolase [Reyranella sp.]MBN9086798.1 serine hydrolase [Reyranella sp.]